MTTASDNTRTGQTGMKAPEQRLCSAERNVRARRAQPLAEQLEPTHNRMYVRNRCGVCPPPPARIRDLRLGRADLGGHVRLAADRGCVRPPRRLERGRHPLMRTLAVLEMRRRPAHRLRTSARRACPRTAPRVAGGVRCRSAVLRQGPCHQPRRRRRHRGRMGPPGHARHGWPA